MPKPDYSNDSGLRVELADVKPEDGSDTGAQPEPVPVGKEQCNRCGKIFTIRGMPVHKAKCRGTGVAVASGPSGEVAEPEPPADIPVEIISLAFVGTFDLLSMKFGEHWKLAAVEGETLGAAWKPVLDYYFPTLDSGRACLAFALIQTAAIVVPRVQHERNRGKGGSNPDRPVGEWQDNPLEDAPSGK